MLQTKTDASSSSPTTTEYGTSVKPNLQKEDFAVYIDGKFGISFKYPKDWGGISTSSINTGVTQEELNSMNIYPRVPKVNATQIIPLEYTISFNKEKCAGDKLCGFYFLIREFSASTPFELTCSPDGGCTTYSLIADSAYVSQHANVNKNGLAWLCTDYYMPEGGSVQRSCRSYHKNLALSLLMSYSPAIQPTQDEIASSTEAGTFKIDNLIGKMADPNDFKLFEARYEEILESISASP